MITKPALRKFIILGSLYVSQYIPPVFLIEVFPVFMRQQGTRLDVIGLLPLLALPLSISFLWAPLVDRYGYTRWGHYRFWIICFQLLATFTIAACAGFEIQQDLYALLICTMLLFFFAATKDIATDALAVQLLNPQERGLGNGIQRGGALLGGVISGGLMLLLLDTVGWKVTLLTIAGIMLVALIPLLYYQEQTESKRSVQTTNQPSTGRSPKFLRVLQDFVTFYRRPGISSWLLILVVSSMSSYMSAAMFRPLLVDVGLSLADIGVLQGIVSYSVGMIAAISAGFWIAPLGRKRSLILFGWFKAIAIALFLLPALGLTTLPTLYLVAIGSQIGFNMGVTISFTIMMDYSRAETAGTDFTLQTSLVYFVGLGTSALSGVLAEAIGYSGVFSVSVLLALLSIVLIVWLFPSDRSIQAKAYSD